MERETGVTRSRHFVCLLALLTPLVSSWPVSARSQEACTPPTKTERPEIDPATAEQASTVTLPPGEMPLSQVLAAISKQTGNLIVDDRAEAGQTSDDVLVRVDFDKTPFWPALDRVLDSAVLTVFDRGGERGLHLLNRPPATSPRAAQVQYAGPFRLEPLRFEAVRDLRNAERSSLQFFVEVRWEPRLQPFAIVHPLDAVRVLGPGGSTIAVEDVDEPIGTLIRSGANQTELEIPIAVASRPLQRLEKISGKFLAAVPGPLEEFRFDDLPVAAKNGRPKPVSRNKNDTVISIDEVRSNNDVWEVAVRIQFAKGGESIESRPAWMLGNEAYFVDVEGKRIEAGGYEENRTLRSGRGEVGINYFFDLPSGPEKLSFVYRTPVVIMELPVDYEFRDLQLP